MMHTINEYLFSCWCPCVVMKNKANDLQILMITVWTIYQIILSNDLSSHIKATTDTLLMNSFMRTLRVKM